MSPHAHGLHKDSSELLSQTVPVESEFCCSSKSEWGKEEGEKEGKEGEERKRKGGGRRENHSQGRW